MPDLLTLWRERDGSRREVKATAQKHVADLDARVAEKKTMVVALPTLMNCCAGDDRPILLIWRSATVMRSNPHEAWPRPLRNGERFDDMVRTLRTR